MKTLAQTLGTFQLAVALLLALVVSLSLTQSGTAERYAKGTTQASSIQNAKELCELGGGTQSVTDSPFEGVKISKCSGGDMDGFTCGHGQKTFNCSNQIAAPGGEIVVSPQVGPATRDVKPASGQILEVNGVGDLKTIEPAADAP